MLTVDNRKIKIHQIVAMIILLILFCFAFLSGIFIYHYGYETLNNLNSIEFTNNNNHLYIIDSRALEKNKQAIEMKDTLNNEQTNKKNIFEYENQIIQNNQPQPQTNVKPKK